jgi:catechol 2,3-dioxygenase-like lactoylglutathione lyase family enzyme
MSSKPMSNELAPKIPTGDIVVELKLEVIFIPVSDVDRARRFYQGMGWRLDADFGNGDNFRVVQMTPPGSQCSIHFGKGVTPAAPGSAPGMILVVNDLQAARAELKGYGVDVSEPFHFDNARRPVPGPDPEGRPYSSFAVFSDPDGNRWTLQEISKRLRERV